MHIPFPEPIPLTPTKANYKWASLGHVIISVVKVGDYFSKDDDGDTGPAMAIATTKRNHFDLLTFNS